MEWLSLCNCFLLNSLAVSHWSVHVCENYSKHPAPVCVCVECHSLLAHKEAKKASPHYSKLTPPDLTSMLLCVCVKVCVSVCRKKTQGHWSPLTLAHKTMDSYAENCSAVVDKINTTALCPWERAGVKRGKICSKTHSCTHSLCIQGPDGQYDCQYMHERRSWHGQSHI